MDTISLELFIKFLERATLMFQEKKDYLCELDAKIGDGDLGITMLDGMTAATKKLKETPPEDIGGACISVGMTFAQTVPSTMGTLIASGFIRAGTKLKGIKELTNKELVLFANSFSEGVMDRGKASLGDRTIVDVLYPAAQAATIAGESQTNLITILQATLDVAKEKLESTKDMKAKFGRAVFYREQVLGTVDQGAIVGMMLYQALFDTINL